MDEREPDGDEPMTPEQAAIIMRNMRRLRPLVVLGLAALAASLHFVKGVSLLLAVGFFLVVTPWTLWYLTRSVGKVVRGEFR